MEEKSSKVRLDKKQVVYKGFNSFYVCELLVSSMGPHPKDLSLKREILHSKNSVSVLIYAPQIDSFVFCRQFRPGLFFQEGEHDYYPLESVAGSLDHSGQDDPETMVKQEAMEEADIELENIQHIYTAYVSPGTTTEKTSIYYAEAKEIPKPFHGGIQEEGEDIQTCIIPRKKVFQLMEDGEIRDIKTLLALNWYWRRSGAFLQHNQTGGFNDSN